MAAQITHTEGDEATPALKALIVDDEAHILEFLEMGFGYEGFDAVTATNADDALRLAATLHPDIVILDVMLIGASGLEVAQRLRQMDDMGIIMLTARDAVKDRILGLDTGADDYVTKPFVFKELMARVRAVLRRRGKSVERTLAFQDLALNRDAHTVMRGDRPIDLTPREFELLELFLTHPRQVLSRDVILTNIWGYDYDGDQNVLEVFIRHLREKLGDTPPRLLQTVRGIGYVLR